MSLTLNIDELLPLIENYRKLHWQSREHELRGYLLDHQLRESGASDDEVDAAFDKHYQELGEDWAYEFHKVKFALLQFIEGPAPAEIDHLQVELLEKVGE